MANEQNLKMITSTAQAKRMGSKGGRKSGETRRLQAAVKEMMDQSIDVEAAREIMDHLGVPKDCRTWSRGIAYAMGIKALSGDIRAAEFLRDTAGEKPRDKQELEIANTTLTTIEDMSISAKRKALDELIQGFGVGGSQ